MFLVSKTFVHQRSYQDFLSRMSHSAENFRRRDFLVFEYLLVLGIGCTCLLQNLMLGKLIGGKSRKFVVIVEIIFIII